jgi:nucleoside recognition membrane protein YjiH
LQIRTVAAIIVWVVVALLMLNRVLGSEWILPISIVLTVIAILIYFSPRLRKEKKSADTEENVPPSEQVKE